MIESVWKRTDVSGSIISARLYNLVIGLVLGWGFLVNFLMVKYIPTETIAAINPIAFYVSYLVY